MTVHVLATGGTISSHFDGTGWTNLDGATLVAEVGAELGSLPVAVEVHEVSAGPSSSLSATDMFATGERARRLLDDGATGVVIIHGTDTLELTAFATMLVLGDEPSGARPTRRPVVVTGSMRVHSHPAPDGPRNLRDAIHVAATPAAAGRGVLVCLNGELHAADLVRKRHAASVDAFHSAPFAPVGHITDGSASFLEPVRSGRPAATGFDHDVVLVTCYPGMTSDELTAAITGRRAAVIEVFGDLNVPRDLWLAVHTAWQAGTLVVLASRAFTPATRDEGLDLLGAVGSGGLPAQQARLATIAALGSTTSRDDAIEWLHAWAIPHDAGERRTTA